MHPGNFQNKLVSSPFNWVSRYISLLGQTEEERKVFFGGWKKRDHILRFPIRALGCHDKWKILSFCGIWNNLNSPLFLLNPLTKKHYRTWSSIINLWIDSMICQKWRILLSARQRSNNYLELSKENVLGSMMLWHWPCFTWKFFMIWFHKILKLISQKQPSCPKNICTEHWRKLHYLTAFLEIFLYLKNNDSAKHV